MYNIDSRMIRVYGLAMLKGDAHLGEHGGGEHGGGEHGGRDKGGKLSSII